MCARLDGLPLALELAAARLRSLSVEEVNQRLDQRFVLLVGGSRSTLPRQQTLRSLIDWSYDLLDEAEQALFCRVAVFAGGWTLEAAERTCSGMGIDKAQMLDLLGSLVDKSLAAVEERNGVTRYRMLETVRQYARDRLLVAPLREPDLDLRRQESSVCLLRLAVRALISALACHEPCNWAAHLWAVVPLG